jgi:hypothetical protein
MKTLLTIAVLAGAFVFADTAAEQRAGSNLAFAQSVRNACFENCAYVRRWPAGQCRRFCRGRNKQFM